jgi:hypothetical protein
MYHVHYILYFFIDKVSSTCFGCYLHPSSRAQLQRKATRHTFLDCCRTAAIQERVTAALRSIPKEAFADSFHNLYERCQQCVVKDGDYFEGQ